jgi:hypothetical protein
MFITSRTVICTIKLIISYFKDSCHPTIRPIIARARLSCQNRILTKIPNGCGYDPRILFRHLWGGRFQMPVIGRRKITGGNGRGPSGRNVLIFFGYGSFLVR